MGNVVGSNIANLFLIISLCAVIKPLHIKKQTRFIDQPFVVFCTVLLYLIIRNDGFIARGEAIILLCFLIAYLLYTILVARYGKKINKYKSINEEEIKKERLLFSKNRVAKILKRGKTKFEEKFPTVFSICLIIIGIVLLKFGGDITVNSASDIALYMGLSQKLISLTIVAIGTSLPELITCIHAARKGETDLAIGNIVGSQIFNILLILGTSAAIMPSSQAIDFADDIMILIFGNIIFMIAPFLNERHRIGRVLGATFVIFYCSYIAIQVLENISIQ